MKRIVLFRFHDHFAVCANRVELIRALNPGVEVHGIYGGTADAWEVARKIPFDSCFRVPIDDAYWKWKHGDLCVRWWFKEAGHALAFDMAHLIEWDYVLLSPLDVYFSHVTDGVAFTGVVTHRERSKEGGGWLWTDPSLGEWELRQLERDVRKECGTVPAEPVCGLFAGASFSRAYLDRYALSRPSSYTNDEMRAPFYALAYGMTVRDLPADPAWFTWEKREILPDTLYAAASGGVRLFHPVWARLDIARVLTLLG